MSSTPIFSAYPEYGQDATNRMGYSQAVKIGNLIRTSGQSGWYADGKLPTDANTQVTRAFENTMAAFKAADPDWDWSHVVSIKSYHLDTEGQFAKMVEEITKRMPQKPTWMCVGVPSIGLPGLQLEIEMEAVLP